MTLGERGDHQAELALCDEVVARYAGSHDPVLRHQGTTALLRRSRALEKIGDLGAALAAQDEFIRAAEVIDGEDPVLYRMLAGAMIERGVLCGKLGDSAEEIRTYDRAIEKFGDCVVYKPDWFLASS